MPSGYFFVMDSHDSSPSIVRYQYKGISSQDGEYPIYLTIDKRQIAFHLAEIGNNFFKHYTLFYLPVNSLDGTEILLSDVIKSISHEPINLKNEVQPIDSQGYSAEYPLKQLSEPHSFTKRQLLLDFLFDFKYTTVFQDLEYYNEIEGMLKNNFLISAIWAKSEYYLFRKEFSETPTTQKNIKTELAIRLKKAEENWLNIIMKEEAIQFVTSNGWFQEAGTELHRVVLPKFKMKDIKSMTLGVFIVNLLKCFLTYLGYGFWNKEFRRPDWLGFLAKESVRKYIQSETSSEIKNYFIKSRDNIISFYLNRLSLFSAYRFFTFHHKGVSFIFYCLYLISIVKGYSYTTNQPVIVKIILLFCITGFYFSVVFPIAIELYFLFSWIVLRINTIPQKYLGTIVALLLVITYLVNNIYPVILLWFVYFCLLVYQILGHYNVNYEYNIRSFNLGLALPNMCIAILSVWMVNYFPFSEEALTLNLDIKTLNLAILAIGILLFIFLVIIYYLKNIIPNINLIMAFIKSTYFIFVGFCFSILVGTLITNFTIDKIFDNGIDYLPVVKGADNILSLNEEINGIEHFMTHYDNNFKLKLNYFDDKYISLGNYLDTLNNKRLEAIDFLIVNHQVIEPNFPVLSKLTLFDIDIYIFPRLLIIYGTISFFIGFLAQAVFQSKAFRHPI